MWALASKGLWASDEEFQGAFLARSGVWIQGSWLDLSRICLGFVLRGLRVRSGEKVS